MGTRQEDAWVDGWNNFLEKTGNKKDLMFLTSDWCEITKDDALGFIQGQAYEGYQVNFVEVWYKGKKAIMLYRGNAI